MALTMAGAVTIGIADAGERCWTYAWPMKTADRMKKNTPTTAAEAISSVRGATPGNRAARSPMTGRVTSPAVVTSPSRA